MDREEAFWGGVRVHMSKCVLPARPGPPPLRQRQPDTQRPNAVAKLRRVQASTRGLEITRSRIAAANSP